MRILAVLGVFSLFSSGLFAGQLLRLKDGRTVSGTLVSGSSDSVVFRDDNGARHTYDAGQIESIDFNNQGSRGFSNNPRPSTYQDSRGTYNDRDTANARSIPAGADIAVRTNEAIDSQTATDGQTFSAEIARDVSDGSGAVIVPRGSPAQLVIRRSTGGGATGSPNLALDLQSVSVRGRRYLVDTGEIEQSNREGIGKNRRTAEMVGGGAALGTLLGAIAGGGKGAAIGAVAGAAAGGTAQVLTRGKEVRVPAETQLTFRLEQPLRLQPSR
jgi:hypothetical protein